MGIEWKDAKTHREPKWPFFGYAPGNYMGRCGECEGTFIDMDKLAYRCLPCAMDAAQEHVISTRNANKALEEQNKILRSAIMIVKNVDPQT